ncbi:hypothetical protein CANINC_002538 [Pichia inconspicua]|uniref:Transcription initiation factor IIF subunit beta n=1 Tax=Pichia inconspicua TaxID=52247 RepID=A0A4T0X285_9ASCO|nr:hypothetical protein CANINC_002538 [[Candida] inconspicua]
MSVAATDSVPPASASGSNPAPDSEVSVQGSANGDLSETAENVAYDEDHMPIPQGIAELNEDQLDQTESVNLDLNGAKNHVWLVRLTPQLAELWRNEEFLHGQQLGTIKVPKNVSKVNPNSRNAKILLKLNKDIPEHANLDEEYELRMLKTTINNEYAFSESQFQQFRQRLMYRTQVVNMPQQPKMKSLNKEAFTHEASWTRKMKNYKKEAQFREMMARDPAFREKRNESGIGSTEMYDEDNNKFGHRGGKDKYAKFKKFIPYAKTIPKKTELVGKIEQECQVIPTKLAADNKLRMLEQRKRLSQMVKRKTINYLKSERVGLMHGRATPNIQKGSTITLSKELAAKKEAAKADGRAARMDRDALMNLLFKLFHEFEYWTLKGLREKTNQPEAYLKECLENIAMMERKGPYALKWRLKDEYRKSIDVEYKVDDVDDDEEKGNKKEGDDDDDDIEDVEMEDIAAL